MGTPTYTPLANLTLGSSAAGVTFSSISQAYRDLVLVVNATQTTAGNQRLRLNGDTGGNYNRIFMTGNGSTTTSSSSSGVTPPALGYDANTGTTAGYQAIINFMDYSATDKHKTFLIKNNNAAYASEVTCTRWASTSEITEIYIYGQYSWASGSTFALYGIAA